MHHRFLERKWLSEYNLWNLHRSKAVADFSEKNYSAENATCDMNSHETTQSHKVTSQVLDDHRIITRLTVTYNPSSSIQWAKKCSLEKQLLFQHSDWKLKSSSRKNVFSFHCIHLIHEFSIAGSIARQPLLMADRACNCWFFFISNTSNGLKKYNIISEKLSFVNSCICQNLFKLPRQRDRRNECVYITM